MQLPCHLQAGQGAFGYVNDDEEAGTQKVSVYYCPHCSEAPPDSEGSTTWHSTSLWPAPRGGRVCPATGKDVHPPLKHDEVEVPQ